MRRRLVKPNNAALSLCPKGKAQLPCDWSVGTVSPGQSFWHVESPLYCCCNMVHYLLLDGDTRHETVKMAIVFNLRVHMYL